MNQGYLRDCFGSLSILFQHKTNQSRKQTHSHTQFYCCVLWSSDTVQLASKMPTSPHQISATEIAQYVRHHSCERRLRLGYDNRSATEELPFAERLFNSLDPVLQLRGEQLENEWANSLRDEGVTEIDDEINQTPTTGREEGRPAESSSGNDGDPHSITWDQFVESLTNIDPGTPVFSREVKIEGEIGVFDVSGRMDFVVLRWNGSEAKLRIVETKSSRKDKTNHYIQVATYKLIIGQLIGEGIYLPGGIIETDDIEYVVGRVDETTNQIEDILQLDPLDLDSETSDVEELLREEGTFERVITTDVENIDKLDYQLNPKCDQCVFDVHCFPESSRKRRLELLGLSPTAIRAFNEEGIETIDELAELNLRSPAAQRLRGDQTVREELQTLKARAEARRQTLPGDTPGDGYPVEPLPNQGQSQLPDHEIEGDRLLRVYLNVDYDYTEDRVIAISAHVTRSEWELETPVEYSQDSDGNWSRETTPSVVEQNPNDIDESRDLRGEDIVSLQPRIWSGDYDRDTASETNLIHDFLYDLIDAITIVAESEEERIHFYVWSESEIDHLIEAASRAGTTLLSHLRELLGCREPLEQMIYSSIRDEVDNRFALGWTGRGLGVATELTWFGNEFHWDRDIAGETVELDRVFEQDVFDFKTFLGLTDSNAWAESSEDEAFSSRFEIRSRFFDSLPVPYMHVIWGSLPDPETFDNPRVINQLNRYNRATRLKLRAYQTGRTHALRWIDEQVGYHNDEITKEPLTVAELGQFDLDVDDAARAAIDFLLLDSHVGTTEWFADNMRPMSHRVPEGEAIPLHNAVWQDDGCLRAILDFDRYDITIDEFRLRTSFDEGSFTRVSPAPDDPDNGPTFGQLSRGGNIFVIDQIDWENETVSLDGVHAPDGRYSLQSYPNGNSGEHYYGSDTRYILTESITDFTAEKVHSRLELGHGQHALRWLDPESPTVPPVTPMSEEQSSRYERLLEALEVGDGHTLQESQIDTILEGLSTRVNLVHGPPGTGKTTTTAFAILLRLVDHLEPGDTVLMSGNTHRSVDNLLDRIAEVEDEFRDIAERLGFDVPELTLVKVDSEGPGGRVVETGTSGNIRELDRYRGGGVLLIGGTVSGVLKQMRTLDGSATFGGDSREFYADELIVDEASMLVFPHFLALSTTVARDGRILLAGDHRQLSPIVAHDWEEEDRPPVELYQPYSSAFEAVHDLADHDDIGSDSIRLSRLEYTFRLPPVIRALISQLYRSYDDTELEGELADAPPDVADNEDPLTSVWEQDTGLFLLTHDERESRVSNPFEADIIEQLLESPAADELDDDSVAVLTPHTAQRSHLQERLEEQLDGPVDVVDTVERLQGGEAENIIVSATASDPTAIGLNEEFLLDLNRSNVAFSRTESRLIVICSQALLNHIPPEVEEYNAAMLWKSLRSICSIQRGQVGIDDHQIRMLVPDPESTEIQEVLGQ